MSVTLDVFHPLKPSIVNVLELYPAKKNIFDKSVTLDVFQLLRSPMFHVFALYPV